MVQGLEALTKMEYPGRFIIAGRDRSGENNVVAYGITGRSPPSRARKLIHDKKTDVIRTDVIRTEVTDKKLLEQGNPALLIYPAVVPIKNGFIVGNGAQTNLLYTAFVNSANNLNSYTAARLILQYAYKHPHFIYDPQFGWIDLTSYEPDNPHFTPRISACVLPRNVAFYIVRHDKN